MKAIEEFRPIKDWPTYEISNLGNVRRSGNPVKIFTGSTKYPGFNAVIGKQRKRLYVHREVARAFLGDFPGLVVRHKNDNPNDFRLENLCWGTQKDFPGHAQERRIAHG